MTEPICREAKKCRACQGELADLIDLGSQFVVDFVPMEEDARLRVPLRLARCEACGLIQLRHSVSKERLFKKFWYRSSGNEMMRNALQDIVAKATEVADVKDGDKVLDIGANDGTLLGWYPGNVTTVGVEPCGELVSEGLEKKRLDIAIKTFFSKEVVETYGPFKVITAIAMFYDLEDPKKFLEDCRDVLTKDGVIIIQMNYLLSMIENLAVDNVCHEHLTYYSMWTMRKLVESAGLELVGAETNEVNGGSFRVYLTHKDSGLHGLGTQKQVDVFLGYMNLLHREKTANLEEKAIYIDFAKRTKELVENLREYLIMEVGKGDKIYAYGASTRGTVLLQLLDLPKDVLLGVAERDVTKCGLKMVGSWLDIYSEELVREKAKQMLVLPWHYEQAIVEREQEWLQKGGKLIFPLPSPRVVDGKGYVKKIKHSESRNQKVVLQ